MTAKHDSTLYKGHVGLYQTGFAGSIIIFMLATLLALNGTATGWEYTWFKAVNDWPEHWKGFVLAITSLGSVWTLAAVVVMTFFAQFYRLAWRLALSTGAAVASVAFFKHFIDRSRPESLFTGINVRTVEIGMGFPSWHATAITIIMLTFLPYLRGKWRFAVPALIISVAMSRLYLGAHIPLDVVGGIALGVAIVSAVRIFPQRLRVLLRID